MHLSHDQIISFQKLYKEQFQEELSVEEASKQAHKLVSFVRICLDEYNKQLREKAAAEKKSCA